jgi:flagellar hook assembly protein FlgD
MRIDTIYPNPFSPTDPEPLKQVAHIQINSPANYKIYLEIFDMEGRLVRRLLTNGQGGFYGPEELIWDGTNDKQEPCPIGIYVLNLKGVTPDGKDMFVRKPIVIATKLH